MFNIKRVVYKFANLVVLDLGCVGFFFAKRSAAAGRVHVRLKRTKIHCVLRPSMRRRISRNVFAYPTGWVPVLRVHTTVPRSSGLIYAPMSESHNRGANNCVSGATPVGFPCGFLHAKRFKHSLSRGEKTAVNNERIITSSSLLFVVHQASSGWLPKSKRCRTHQLYINIYWWSVTQIQPSMQFAICCNFFVFLWISIHNSRR